MAAGWWYAHKLRPMCTACGEAAHHEIILSDKLLGLEVQIGEGGQRRNNELLFCLETDDVGKVCVMADVVALQQPLGGVRSFSFQASIHRRMITLFSSADIATSPHT